MSPVGHLSISYLAVSLFKKISIPAIIVGSLIPDITFIFLPFPFFNQIHRQATHSLLFIVLFAVIIGLWIKDEKKLNFIFSFILGGFLHLLTDSCLDTNPTNGIGVPFLWPFSDKCLSPFNICTQIEAPGWSAPLEMLRLSFHVLIWELPFFLTAIFIYFKKKNKPSIRS